MQSLLIRLHRPTARPLARFATRSVPLRSSSSSAAAAAGPDPTATATTTTTPQPFSSTHLALWSLPDPSSPRSGLASLVPVEPRTIPCFSDHDVDAAVRQAAASPWPTLPSTLRRDLLLRLAVAIDNHRDQLALIETRQTGKVLHDARWEVSEVAETFRYYAGWADKIEGRVHDVGPTAPASVRLGMSVAQPKGVVAAVTSFNYPLLLAAWKVAPALAAGNTVVLKPAEFTPLSSLALRDLLPDSRLKSAIQVTTGGAATGQSLVAHPLVNHVSFTGSTAAGRQIAAAHPLKSMTLELGGKNALYVDESADLPRAVDIAIDGGWANAGQNCCAASRIVVHEKVHEEFVDKLVKALHDKLGCMPHNLYSPRATMGLIATPQHASKIRAVLATHSSDLTQSFPPADILTPVTPLPPSDKIPSAIASQWIPPTLYTKVHSMHPLAQTELFGPVVCVLSPVKSVAEAIDVTNASEYGLAAGIVAKNASTIHKYTAGVKAGMVWVNTWNSTPVGVPFGGWKASGRGKELGWKGIEEYMQWKSVVQEMVHA